MPKLDVIVIGAGAAGLAAAQTLTAAGKKVVVIEAQDRIGGRIHTIREGGAVVEAGAEFVHGEHAVTWDLIREERLETRQWKPKGETFVWKYGEDGGIKELPEKIKEGADTLWDSVYDYHGPDISLTDYVATQPVTIEAQHFTRDRLARLESAPPSDLSVLGVAEADRLGTSGELNTWIINGYDQILTPLSKDLNIRLSQPARSIEWSEGQVIVRCEGGLVLEAERLICTIPLGVLADNLSLFTPAPPTDFVEAVSRIGYGNVTKPTFWIEGKIEPFQILGTRYPINFWQRDWKENTVLVGFTSYDFARELAALSETEALEKVVPIIEDALGTDVVRRIRHARHFEWSNNPYIRGAYTYPKVGMGTARETLRAPFANTVFYAGEATHTKGHASTVHGAIEEGRSAAERILAL